MAFGFLGKAAKFGLGAGKKIGGASIGIGKKSAGAGFGAAKAGLSMGKNLANPKNAMKPSSVTGPTMGVMGSMFGKKKKKTMPGNIPNPIGE